MSKFQIKPGYLWYVFWILVATFVAQGLALGHSPTLITEVQYAGSRLTLQRVLEAWESAHLWRWRVALAVIVDFATIACYVPLLITWIENLKPITPPITSPLGWQRTVLIAGAADVVENLLTLILLWQYPHLSAALTALLFYTTTVKMFALGLVGLYLLWLLIRWPFFQGAWEIVRLCGFSLFAAVFAPVIIAFGNQGAEVYQILSNGVQPTADHTVTPVSLAHYFLGMLLTFYFSFVCWSAARAIVATERARTGLNAPPSSAQSEGVEWASIWIPRVCGVLPSVLLLLLVIRPERWVELWAVSIGTLIVGILIWLWMVYRRRILCKGDAACIERHDNRWLRWMFFIGLASTGIACISPATLQWVSRIGPLAAWLLSFLLMIPFFSYLISFGKKHRRAYLGFFLAYGFLCNAANLNDDHGVRHIYREGWPTPQEAHEKALSNAFDTWLQRSEVAQWRSTHNNKPYPVLFLAAAGGGIVAGSLVTATMGEIQDQPDLKEAESHLFAISGVSGGSVGSWVYAALRMKHRYLADNRKLARKIMTHDMLSPTVASFLSPELVQRFLFFAPQVRNPPFRNEFRMDRGRALELALNNAINEALGPDPQPITDLLVSQYPAPGPSGLPALFLNTTCVETGDRMVISTLRPDAQAPALRYSPSQMPFETLTDVDKHLDLEMTAAACLSARFPLVSPPGFLPRPQRRSVGLDSPEEQPWLLVKSRYVDGGYYEVSGIQTARDVIATLQSRQYSRDQSWEPVLISVAMGPNDLEPSEPDHVSAPPRKTNGFDELLGPVDAFLNGWGGPPGPERRRANQILEEKFISLRFPQPQLLGWYLSTKGYDAVVEQARSQLRSGRAGQQLRTALQLGPAH